MKEEKNIMLEVTSEIPSTTEDFNETVLNYEYIISEIQNEIDSAVIKGIDVKLPQETLNEAKTALEIAKDYYQHGNYDNARIKLAEVKKYLEDAVYQLAVAGISIQMPASHPIYLILIIIIIGIFLGISIILLKRKREEETQGAEAGDCCSGKGNIPGWILQGFCHGFRTLQYM
jgi:hypothetical protein